MVIIKPFDHSEYKRSDAKAKKIAAELFLDLYPNLTHITESISEYAIDLELYENYKLVGYLETEIKYSWKGSTFPFKTIQFPERKTKYLCLQFKTWFCMINATCTYALIVDAEDIKSSPLKMVPNKKISKGEKFFQVPLAKAAIYKL